MKRLYLILLCIILISEAKAQTLFDAINLSDQPIEGTARAMAMSGAFGALGGDPSAIQINPAGLGIYRSSEISFTLADTYSKTKSKWGVFQKNKGENVFDFSRISYVQSFLSGREKGLIASNFAISYNRSKSSLVRLGFIGTEGATSFSTAMAEMGNGISELDMISYGDKSPFDNEQVAWLPLMAYQANLIEAKPGSGSSYQALKEKTTVAPTYNSLINYAIDDISISYAANINHLFYIGADFSMKLYQRSEVSEYCEDFILENQIETTGIGWNFKLGLLARPFSFWRVGFAYHTPTFYHISKTTAPQLNDSIAVEGSDAYRFSTPSRYLFSTAFLFDKKAAIDIEYEIADYTSMSYRSLSQTLKSDGNPFSRENRYIKNSAKIVHSVKVGAEYRPFEFLSFRIGGAYVSPAVKGSAEKQYPYNTIYTNMDYSIDKGSYYVSGGVGFRVKVWSFDLAYQFRQQMFDFMAFSSAEKATFTADYHKVLLTCAYRF